MTVRTSRCSEGNALRFSWVGYPQSKATDDLEAIVLTFEDAMKVSPRYWDVRHWAMTRSEYRSRIARAMLGRLKPLAEVAEIDRAANEFVFEIKFDFDAIEIDSNQVRKRVKVKTRTYISEPPAHVDAFTGLHLHEKRIVKGNNHETNRLQNIEIDIAVRYYDMARARSWGLSPLTPNSGE